MDKDKKTKRAKVSLILILFTILTWLSLYSILTYRMIIRILFLSFLGLSLINNLIEYRRNRLAGLKKYMGTVLIELLINICMFSVFSLVYSKARPIYRDSMGNNLRTIFIYSMVINTSLRKDEFIYPKKKWPRGQFIFV